MKSLDLKTDKKPKSTKKPLTQKSVADLKKELEKIYKKIETLQKNCSHPTKWKRGYTDYDRGSIEYQCLKCEKWFFDETPAHWK